MLAMLRFTLPVIFAATLFAPWAAQAREEVPYTINQRQANQQQRIYNGVKDGEINRQEYRNLERRSLAIEQQQRRDRRDGSGLTARERAQLNQRLNRVSDAIYRDRHD